MPEDLSERLMAHYVAGMWIAPLSERALALAGPGGAPLGRLVLGGAADVARAVEAAREAAPDLALTPAAERRALLARLVAETAAALPALRRAAGADGEAALAELRALRVAGEAPPAARVAAVGPAPFPQIVRSVAGVLGSGAAVVLVPGPEAALAAMVWTDALDRAGAAPGAFNLVQGDAATAAALRAHPGVAPPPAAAPL